MTELTAIVSVSRPRLGYELFPKLSPAVLRLAQPLGHHTNDRWCIRCVCFSSNCQRLIARGLDAYQRHCNKTISIRSNRSFLQGTMSSVSQLQRPRLHHGRCFMRHTQLRILGRLSSFEARPLFLLLSNIPPSGKMTRMRRRSVPQERCSRISHHLCSCWAYL